MGELCRTHTRAEAVLQEEVSHHNYRPNRQAVSFFIQTAVTLQGEADGEEEEAVCVCMSV